MESQQIGFTPEQYQTMLALLQQAKSCGNGSSQVSVIPSNMTTQTSNNFISSFSSWIIDVMLLITFVHPYKGVWFFKLC